MKKKAAMILCGVIALGITACRSEAPVSAENTPAVTTEAENAQPAAEETKVQPSAENTKPTENTAPAQKTADTATVEKTKTTAENPAKTAAPAEKAPQPAAPVQNNTENYPQRVVALVNKEREAKGLAPLTLHAGAAQAAQLRAKEVKTTFSHTRPDGSVSFTAMEEAGVSYHAIAENIAGKIQSPEAVVQAWMHSDGHRNNILSSEYTQIGVGYADGGYWSMFFIN